MCVTPCLNHFFHSMYNIFQTIQQPLPSIYGATPFTNIKLLLFIERRALEVKYCIVPFETYESSFQAHNESISANCDPTKLTFIGRQLAQASGALIWYYHL